MDTEKQKIFEEQLEKLPIEVIQYISSLKWNAAINEISLLANLSEYDASIFRNEIILVLLGIVHPEAIRNTLTEGGIINPALDLLVSNVEKMIFAEIHPFLVAFFEKEASENKDVFTPLVASMPGIITPNKMTAKTTPAPENIPTPDTTESFLPKLIPKVPVAPTTESTPTLHPFEDKMKQSFTAGETPARIVSVETPAPIVPVPPKVFTPTAPVAPAVPTPQTYVTPKPEAPGVYKVDPYREPI